MDINNNLSLKENLMLLNIIARHQVDSDADIDGILYIAVDFQETKNLIEEIICNEDAYKEYINAYLENETIDISLLWVEVLEKFKKEIWYNMIKREFYVARWYHKAERYFKDKKREIKYKIRNIKSYLNMRKLQRKYRKEIYESLKRYCK